MTPVPIYIVRHGATEFNKEAGVSADRIRGHIDLPLAESGRVEAESVAQRLAEYSIRRIFSSDLRRASETAQILAKNSRVPLVTLYGLRPWKLGPLIEGQLTNEVQPRIKFFFENAQERPPGGETFTEFRTRVFETLREIEQQSLHAPTAVVTHYRCVKLLEARTEELEIDPATFLRDGESTGAIRTLLAGKLCTFPLSNGK